MQSKRSWPALASRARRGKLPRFLSPRAPQVANPWIGHEAVDGLLGACLFCAMSRLVICLVQLQCSDRHCDVQRAMQARVAAQCAQQRLLS
jgi:hypothetical protein